MGGNCMKKMFFVSVIFILMLFTVYDYFDTSQATYFIPLTNQVHMPKATISDFDNDVLNIEIPEDSVFQKQMINATGNIVIITKKETVTENIFYLLIYDKDYLLLVTKEIILVKQAQTNNLLYPDLSENLIHISQISTMGDPIYKLVTNRSIINISEGNYLKDIIQLPYWILAFKQKENDVPIQYFNTKNVNTIQTQQQGHVSFDNALPPGDYSILNDDSLLSINGGIITNYDDAGKVRWSYKYKEIDNHVKFNDKLIVEDGDIILVGSYHPTQYIDKYKLFNQPDKIKSIRDGVILRINSETGKVIWEQNIKGHVNDKIDLLSINEDDLGNLDVFGFYDIKSPTIFFSIRLDEKGSILGDKIFQFASTFHINDDTTNESTTYSSDIMSLYFNDTSLYNQDKIIILGHQVGNNKPFMIQYEVSDYQNEINYLNTDTYKYHNYLILIDTVVCGIIVIAAIYVIIRKFDRNVKKNKKK